MLMLFGMVFRYVAEPLDDDEQEEKDRLIAEGFEDWSRRDFQQFVRGLETYGWFVCSTLFSVVMTNSEISVWVSRTEDLALLASEIQDKSEDDIKAYYPVFKQKWQTLSGEAYTCT